MQKIKLTTLQNLQQEHIIPTDQHQLTKQHRLGRRSLPDPLSSKLVKSLNRSGRFKA